MAINMDMYEWKTNSGQTHVHMAIIVYYISQTPPICLIVISLGSAHIHTTTL